MRLRLKSSRKSGGLTRCVDTGKDGLRPWVILVQLKDALQFDSRICDARATHVQLRQITAKSQVVRGILELGEDLDNFGLLFNKKAVDLLMFFGLVITLQLAQERN